MRYLKCCLIFLLAGLLHPVFAIAADKDVREMTDEDKARIVVGLERKFFPPTNDGFCARTVPFPEYGIPSIVLADGTAGLRLSRRGKDRATAFPSNTALASSWSQALALEIGSAVGYEARHYNANVLLAPGMNIIRNPLCGRNFEYYSEDPIITGKLASAYVKGIQSNGVASSAKHFACNNQETNRTNVDARVSERALREIFLKGFEICVKEAEPWTVMSSYNRINSLPMQEHPRMLTDILRNEWGYKGLVMTDWSISPHDTKAQIHAGNDLLMPGMQKQTDEIIEALRNGGLDIKDLDRASGKVMELVKKCRFEPESQKPDLNAGAAVARKAAIESAVLLENNGMLPLKGNSAAVFGVRSYDLVTTGAGAGFVACPYVSQIYSAFEENGVTIDSQLKELYLKYVDFASADIKYNEKIKVHIGRPLLPELELSKSFIEKTAKDNDYAVITIGRHGEEGKDRSLDGDYYLSDVELSLVKNVCEAYHALGKKVAVVLNISSVIDIESWKKIPDAILNVWFPGQEGGSAVYDLLSGKENPSGRLPLTFAKSYTDYPTAVDFPFDHPKAGKNYDYTDYSEGIYVGYRYFTTKNVGVTYPFGYGLSYTCFSYSDTKVFRQNGRIIVSVKITNTGKCAGKEASGVYVSAPDGRLEKPAVELKAFGKTALLQPGESEIVKMEIPLDYLSSYNDRTSCWERSKGKYTIRIGADVSSPIIEKTINL